MRLSQATPSTVREVWIRRCSFLPGRLPARPYIGHLPAAAVDGLYETFEESLVMVRAFG